MANSNLLNAKRAKQDEFYTQLVDIEKEMGAYLEYNPDVFRGKTILLPCDDPEWSNFTKYFAVRFRELGIKKLISTSYAPCADGEGDRRGKIFILDGTNRAGDIAWDYLDGDGDFRSDEVTALRDEADMVITNPPFSLFRDFMAWLVDGDAQFSIIGNKNAIANKEIFPLIKENHIWMGSTPMGRDMLFEVPEVAKVELMKKREGSAWRRADGEVYARAAACWFTNIEHGRRHDPLPLMTMEDNKSFNKKIIKNPTSYMGYDNYDAIEVPVTAGIPSDYDGVMGVPISFWDKYCPEQFEIVGMANRGAVDPTLVTRIYTADDYPNYSSLNAGPVLIQNGEPRNTYTRILIRHITNDSPEG